MRQFFYHLEFALRHGELNYYWRKNDWNWKFAIEQYDGNHMTFFWGPLVWGFYYPYTSWDYGEVDTRKDWDVINDGWINRNEVQNIQKKLDEK